MSFWPLSCKMTKNFYLGTRFWYCWQSPAYVLVTFRHACLCFELNCFHLKQYERETNSNHPFSCWTFIFTLLLFPIFPFLLVKLLSTLRIIFEVCERWTTIYCAPYTRHLNCTSDENSLRGLSRQTAAWKTMKIGGQQGQFNISSCKVGQSLSELTPLFLTACVSSGQCCIPLRALRPSQQMAPVISRDVCG